MENIINVIPMPNKINYLGGKTKTDFVPDISISGKLAEEEYILNVDSAGIKIEGGSEKAVFYAKQTLRQLGNECPCVRIEDKPAFPYRGFMLDTVRHIFSVEDTKKLIDAAASVKMNVMHWHLADDQGYRIESKVFPKLNEVASKRRYDNFAKRNQTDDQPDKGNQTVPEKKSASKIFSFHWNLL
jgi:hexosaminidase